MQNTEVPYLPIRVEEQENASRRQNLRVVGLPEGVEGVSATEVHLEDVRGAGCRRGAG